ncbi:uncharacterized protein B0J16DRAFT_347983 [Fusarium flagelliforme]|uniref:uncharacterized protein n=1 Tax=Fusarium flagelliforme TaxID=2675880 RepID=UPI001E8E7D44|nr:uncharacterized protein B0J16DRAFT_347983 [Fusarium flagelliforme]KAH7179966.1 hypothetical protein B0J16DRAFT_347983 [Fusarium flagelliforme]
MDTTHRRVVHVFWVIHQAGLLGARPPSDLRRVTATSLEITNPLSLASGLIAIITATIQLSKILYQTVQSFRDHPRSVQQLGDELQALNGVLRSLEAFAGAEPSILVPLKLPLEQCTKACADFHKLILKCTRHSGASGNTSFRD